MTHDSPNARGGRDLHNELNARDPEEGLSYYQKQTLRYGRARRGSTSIAGAWEAVFAEGGGGGDGGGGVDAGVHGGEDDEEEEEVVLVTSAGDGDADFAARLQVGGAEPMAPVATGRSYGGGVTVASPADMAAATAAFNMDDLVAKSALLLDHLRGLRGGN